MGNTRVKKKAKRPPRNTGAKASPASGGKKRLADALRRNLGKRRNQARRRGES